MNTTILQIPIKKDLRDRATAKAAKMGFSSLQEVIRLFLNKMAVGEINVTFEEPAVRLSPKAIKRYNKMIDDMESGKVKMKSFSDVKSLMSDLNGNSP